MSAKSSSSWAQRAKVKFKFLAPMGVTLTPSETVVLSEIYEKDAAVLKDNTAEVKKAIAATEKIMDIDNSLRTAVGARNQASGTYKITKDPIKKREWARRVVVADQTIKSLRDVKKRLGTTHDRLTMIKGDMELQYIEAEARAQEMKAYASAGNSLRLAGEKLIQARSRANKLKLEYDNLEVTMEGAEKMTSSLSPQELIKKANAIVGGDVSS